MNNGIDLNQVFAQNDMYQSGFISRSAFAAILRDYNVPIPDSTMHFLVVLLSSPSDTTSVSYIRFMDMVGQRSGINVRPRSTPNNGFGVSPSSSSW